MLQNGAFVAILLKDSKPSFKEVVILCRLYVVNSEEVSEEVVCKENEVSSEGKTCRLSTCGGSALYAAH